MRPSRSSSGRHRSAPPGRSSRCPAGGRSVTVEILETSPPAPTVGDATPVGSPRSAGRRRGRGDAAAARRPARPGRRAAARPWLDIVLTRLRAGPSGEGPPATRSRASTDLRAPGRAHVRDRRDRPGRGGPAGRAGLRLSGRPAGGGRDPAAGPHHRGRRAALQLEAVRAAGARAGSHRVTAAAGAEYADLASTGSCCQSGRDGEPADVAPRGASRRGRTRPSLATSAWTRPPSRWRSTRTGTVLVGAGAEPQRWLGRVDVDGASAGARQVVNGYANGWVITPDGDGAVVVRRAGSRSGWSRRAWRPAGRRAGVPGDRRSAHGRRPRPRSSPCPGAPVPLDGRDRSWAPSRSAAWPGRRIGARRRDARGGDRGQPAHRGRGLVPRGRSPPVAAPVALAPSRRSIERPQLAWLAVRWRWRPICLPSRSVSRPASG